MPVTRLTFAAFAAGLLVLGCQDLNEVSAPSGPDSRIEGASAADIRGLIADLFDGGLETAALRQFRNIERKQGTDDAVEMTADLVAFTLEHFENGDLEQPPVMTQEEAVAELISELYEYVGLAEEGEGPPPGAFTEEGAAEQCQTGQECQVITGTEFAGFVVPAGVEYFVDGQPYDGPVTFFIERQPDTADPFESLGYADYPLFYSFGSNPVVTFGTAITAGVCVVDPPDPLAPPDSVVPFLRLAHLVADTVEVTELADASFIDCTDATTTALGPTGWRGLVMRLLEPAAGLLDATPLFASPGKLGGAILSFSPFGAVDMRRDTMPDDSMPGVSLSTTIVFEAQNAGNFEIFSLTIGESDTIRTQLTNNTALDLQPSLSPDGTRIAFLSYANDGTGNFEIAVMDRDGGNATNITNTPSVAELFPAWSPDGSRIAFTLRSASNDDIYVMNADGSNRVQLTNHAADDFEPTWSPDGSKIAFSSYRTVAEDPRPQPEHIWVMEADGSNQVNLTTNVSFNGEPAWSPDGTRIAFISNRSGNRDIHTMAADGSDVVALTTTTDAETFPAWSPDGSEIAFAIGTIYTMPSSGGTRRALTTSGSNPYWGITPVTLAASLAPASRTRSDDR